MALRERNKLIVSLFNEGMSYTQVRIALYEKTGCVVSRNTVAGVLARAREKDESNVRRWASVLDGEGVSSRSLGESNVSTKQLAAPWCKPPSFETSEPDEKEKAETKKSTHVAFGPERAPRGARAHMALEDRQCRFPVGDPLVPEFRYCCAETEAKKKGVGYEIYCPAHKKLTTGRRPGNQNPTRSRPLVSAFQLRANGRVNT